jgi:chromosome segregation ATPase
MAGTEQRLQAIQEELNRIAEERVTDLLAHLRAAREVTSRIAVTELEIARQEQLRRGLDEEVGPLETRVEALKSENGEIQSKVDNLTETVKRLRKMREELMSSLSGLTSEIKTLGGG